MLILLLFRAIWADFTPHFRAFIHNNYGIAIAQMLERTDLGIDASFGGKESDDDELNNQAVILIHGIGNKITRLQVIGAIFLQTLKCKRKFSLDREEGSGACVIAKLQHVRICFVCVFACLHICK